MLKVQGAEHLRPDQLQAIKDHKYSCRGSSILEKYFQIFWCGLLPYIPHGIAPNTLTISGLILNVIGVLILLYYSPDLKTEVPSWSLVLAALCVFIYQTLDALDGKHARRLNLVSPLGEIFDHGCDAIATVFVPLSICVSVGIGSYPIVVFCQFFTFISLFYLAHWQCYITGYLEFGRLDVTEGQVGVIFILLLSSIFGVKFWSNRIPIIGIPLQFIPFIVIMALAIANIVRFVSIISQGGAGKAGTTIANTSVLFPAFPFGLIMFLTVMVAVRSPLHLYSNHIVLFLITFGFVAVKVILKLVVDHMSKSEMTFMDSILVGPLALFFNQYFNCPIPESFVLWCCCILAVSDTILFSGQVCVQLADYLNIYVFRVDKPPPRSSEEYYLRNCSSRLAGSATNMTSSTVTSSTTAPLSSARHTNNRSRWGPQSNFS